MNNYLSLPLQYPDNLERTQSYPVKLMQHQEELVHYLAQRINHIIANSSVTALMLQEIAKLLGVTFNVDCCCLVTVTHEVSDHATAANWCSDEYLRMPHPSEMFSMEQLMMDLPVVQCAAEPLTIENISTIQNSLVVGCQYLPLPIKSVLALPTRLGGKNNGVICLIKFDNHNW